MESGFELTYCSKLTFLIVSETQFTFIVMKSKNATLSNLEDKAFKDVKEPFNLPLGHFFMWCYGQCFIIIILLLVYYRTLIQVRVMRHK